jgi:hypothetical protein
MAIWCRLGHDVGHFGHEMHAAEDDVLGVGLRGEARQLERVAGQVGVLIDVGALVVVAKQHGFLAEARAGGARAQAAVDAHAVSNRGYFLAEETLQWQARKTSSRWSRKTTSSSSTSVSPIPVARNSTSTVPVSAFDEDKFENGHAFDGSSIAGWKGIQASDMQLMPDPATAYIDPFFDETTLVI